MPSLKDLRNRIDSVKSTKKITQAMKMVAASKLKKAQSVAEKGRNYSAGIEDIVKRLVSSDNVLDHPLINSNQDVNKAMLIVVSSDRGLCGGLNTNIVKKTRFLIRKLEGEKKNVTIICLGKKGYDALHLFNKSNFDYSTKTLNVSEINYDTSERMGSNIIDDYYRGQFSECYILYNYFKSVISQEVKTEKLLPYEKVNQDNNKEENTFFDYEPEVEEVLSKILPKNFIVQIYKAVLESRASEQGARMTAMDNATRNAGDMIDSLSLKYNRQRQAIITKELIEIISGAEAL